MNLRAAAYYIVVTPTGDNNETERGRLVIVQNDQPTQTIYRGVVDDIGCRVQEDHLTEGCVAHYTGYHDLGERHVVPHQNLIAWESE